MPTEIQYLLYSVALYLAMIVMQAVAATFSRKATVGELVGARDDLPATGLNPLHGRAKRAQANMTEGMMMFVPLILAAAYLDAFSPTTALGAALFFFGRLAFAPLYYFGVPWLRTLAWFASIAGIVLILWELIV
ncbi:MAPEG family protein [uncultured Algimonas sp.]|uniref:MAPEG family protein n=1 Tax=uncultured Algimonas sp. TaxID=1547920 RepID=UPI00262005B5|nr:MAPEG family protein [uncultured Algimonas sp.]